MLYGFSKHIKINMTEEMREGVINVRYVKGGRVLTLTTGYVGYAGIITGMKPVSFLGDKTALVFLYSPNIRRSRMGQS